MTTDPSSLSPAPALTNEATLDAALDCLLEHIPLQMEGEYTSEDLFEMLLRTASRSDSIEHTTQGTAGREPIDRLCKIARLIAGNFGIDRYIYHPSSKSSSVSKLKNHRSQICTLTH